MTKKEIIHSMEGSPLMLSIRRGTLEQLLAFQQQLRQQIRERKAATWRSCASVASCSIIGSSLAMLFIKHDLRQLILIYLAGLFVCMVYWLFAYGAKFYKAKAMEKVMTTLVEAVIEEKRLASTAA